MAEPASAATLILQRLSEGDRQAADELLPLVYDELHGLARHHMRGERQAHTLQATALLHEAFLRMVAVTDPSWEGRGHFLRVASKAMRHVLVDHARARGAQKRGGDQQRVPLDDAVASFESRAEDLIALDDALTRLAANDEQLARIVELRFFGGQTVPDTARALGVSPSTVERGWRIARVWLKAELSGEDAEKDEPSES
jgi:RNA polymerase sigma factor (TIGR02999 family)